ncbi:hypothetical protein RB595_009326 [Gaeumannomyces hyphopodioides]
MVVQQHILNWLYSVLTSEYHDVNRTYNDVAQALSLYPSLSPRTDVHTFPNGVSALLLHLSGTIPVVFRGTTYRFPISLWVPHAYPREAPLVYVTPTENMVVRPGQHVDPQGQVYHPYLVGWAGFWDKSTILDFLAILRDVFAKEPPVIAKQQQPGPAPAQQPTATPPPVPPLPPDMARPASTAQTHVQTPAPAEQRPPPPPPKGDDPPIHRPSPVPLLSRSVAPPVPPYGAQDHRPLSQVGTPEAAAMQPPPSNRASRYDSAPPLPPQSDYASNRTSQAGPPPPTHPPYRHPQFPPGQLQRQTTPAAAVQVRESFPPADPRHASSPPPQHAVQGAPPPGQSHLGWQQQQPHPSRQYGDYQQTWPPQQQHHPHSAAGVPPSPQPMAAPRGPPQQPAQKPPPPPDLMDEPLVLSIPSPSNVPAPPIPPNPEKDALMHQLAQTLHAMRQRARAQDEASLQGLQAQRTAMLAALGQVQAETSQLSQLSALLTSNAGILRDALHRADAAVADAQSHRIKPPDVDELLVAPTVVANQLYDLVAEERALADAIFVLGRAVERGRVSPTVFAKTTRSLAREWYLKKALVRKIGRGMGLIQQ